MREDAVAGACPTCGGATLVMRSLPLSIPYFGDALQTTVLCTACTFRHADLILTSEGPPMRYELAVDAARLDARVVRSAAGTIRIPELRAAIEPGLQAEAFVSNAEGVLRRIRDIVSFIHRTAGSDPAKRRAARSLAAIDEMIGGLRPFTLVLEDPTGNSAIVHEAARKRRLTAQEARRLKAGVPAFRIVG